MLARLEGRVFFVDGALPGELVKAKVVKDEKDFSLATVTEILTPHPERISPRCSLAGYCGGCDWQHATASLQKEMKLSILKQAFSQFVPALELPKIDYSPSPLAFNYRNRVRPKFKSGRPCFVGKDGKTLVPFDYCHIAKDAINSSLDRLGDLNDLSIEIFLKEDGSVHFRELSAETEGLHFSQVNSEQNIEIQNWIISHCAQIQPKIVLDLYGGAGNFGLPISRKFRKTLVRSIEASPPLSSYGYKISRGLGNIDFFCSRSELFLRRYVPVSYTHL
ncbi:MAG: hypothetical protein N2578_05055, partial [Bdellovibrionaceae bacterium]|nr:hypothetical protein [Pseudobdellovibrionaceae bacterium]